ncbi:MAG: alpha/beta hydrolase [Candidatus Wenzhouxiangella sp. M2_3B_020]
MVSWQTRTAKLLGRLTIRQSLKHELSIDDMRARIRAMERFFPDVPDDVRIDVEPGLSNCDAEWVTPMAGDTERVVLHLPGGAFMTRFERAERVFLARLCRAAHARGRLVFYRLAPENPFPAGLDDCVEAYRQLLDLGVAPEHIFVSGMSAGGCLALALMLTLRDEEMPMPAGAVLMSPAADFTERADTGSRVDNARRDALLSLEQGDEIRRLYLGGRTELARHPYVSPVLGDFAGLPPLFFQVSSTEILLDDSRRCSERARAAGVPAEVDLWDRMPHGWQALSVTPESGRAIGRLADFIREQCP